MKKLWLILWGCLVMQACGQPTLNPPVNVLLQDLTVSRIDSVFDQKNEEYKSQDLEVLINEICKNLNGTLLIAKGDSVIFRRTTGLVRFYENKKGYEKWTQAEMNAAKKKASNKLKNDTFYELASISKQFTAAAILKLAEEKKLALTDTLNSIFPELPYKNITIQHLLSHTSGLPEYFDFPVSYFDTSQILTNQHLIEVLSREKPKIQFLPGYNYKYTNTNYALLYSVIEKISGESYEEYVQKNLFLPAGMTQTFFVSQIEDNSNKSIAKGHLRNKEELKRYYLDGTMGDKGIYSTPEELLKWKTAYFNRKKIIPDKLLAKASSKQNFIKGKGVAKEIYGYGLRIEENPHYGKLIYHGGLWRGYQNLMIYRPSDDLFIVFLSNYRNNAHKGKSNDILHIIDGV